jgi:hypothetical protein
MDKCDTAQLKERKILEYSWAKEISYIEAKQLIENFLNY